MRSAKIRSAVYRELSAFCVHLDGSELEHLHGLTPEEAREAIARLAAVAEAHRPGPTG